jgi:cytochrome c-type biogenesis protein CcmH
MLIALIALLTVAIAAAVVLPLMRARGEAPPRGAFDQAVYRDQLKELERDLARGLIDAKEASGARLEIERRLLAADTRGAADAAPTQAAASPRFALALALLLPMTALVLYLLLGAPGLPDQPYAARGPERALAAANGPAELEKTAASLREKLQANPENDSDWLLLGRTEAALGHWQKSAEAYRQALRVSKGQPDVAAAYGEMLVMAADGVVTPGAREAFTAAIARDPKNVVARYYMGQAEAQEGHAAEAIDAWQKLAADVPEGSEVRRELRSRIVATARAAGLPAPQMPAEAAAPAPTAADMAQAAQMTPEQRTKMETAMVERLASKLEANPDDPDGWMRLGNDYTVLGQRDKAADAFERAATLKPTDPQILLAEAAALYPQGTPAQTPVPPRVVALMKRIEALEPKQPAALYYLGLAAVQQRNFSEASSYWERLSEQLPANSQQRKAIVGMLDAIKGK